MCFVVRQCGDKVSGNSVMSGTARNFAEVPEIARCVAHPFVHSALYKTGMDYHKSGETRNRHVGFMVRGLVFSTVHCWNSYSLPYLS